MGLHVVINDSFLKTFIVTKTWLEYYQLSGVSAQIDNSTIISFVPRFHNHNSTCVDHSKAPSLITVILQRIQLSHARAVVKARKSCRTTPCALSTGSKELNVSNTGSCHLKTNSITLAGSQLVRSWFETGSRPNSITLSGSNQLRTSSEPASVIEFGREPASSC